MKRMKRWEELVAWDKVLGVLNDLDSEYEYSFAFPGSVSAFGPAAGKAVVRRGRGTPWNVGFINDPLITLTELLSKVNSLVEDANLLIEGARELGWSIPDADYFEDDRAGLGYHQKVKGAQIELEREDLTKRSPDDIDIEEEGWIITDSSPYNVETVLERVNDRLHEHGLKVVIGDDKSSDVWFRIAKETGQ